MGFCFSASKIRNELSLVTEMKSLIEESGELPLAGIHPIGESLQRASLQGTVLTTSQLLQIALTLHTARTIRTFLARYESAAPLLWEIASGLEGNRVLEFNITRAIEESGAVRTNASKELQ